MRLLISPFALEPPYHTSLSRVGAMLYLVQRMPSAQAVALQAAPQRRHWALPLLIPLVIFSTIFPTLGWVDFSNNIEVVSTATSLETRRDGHWLLPTLLGEPRTFKPPLAYWAAATAARPATVDGLNDPDDVARGAAYRRFAVEIRWPFLAAACVMLAAVYELAETLGGHGLPAAAIAGTNLLFLRWDRMVSPDALLALSVTTAEVFMAKGVMHGWRGRHCLPAGAALGLAIMCKGPVALLETLVPIAFFAWWWGRQHSSRGSFWPLMAGIGTMLAVAVPWFAYVGLRVPGVFHVWFSQGMRVGTNDQDPDPWYAYLEFFRLFLPWTVWWVIGLIGAWGVWRSKQRQAWMLAVFLFLVPIVLMSIAPQRKDRYLLPMVGPAAIIAARGMQLVLGGLGETARKIAVATVGVHWVVVFGLTVVVPIALGMRLFGLPWYGTGVGVAAGVISAVFIAAGAALGMRSGARMMPIVVTTAASVLVFNAVYFYGYRNTPAATTEMKDLAGWVWGHYPTARLYMMEPPQTRYGKGLPATALALYCDRVVHAVSEPAEVPPAAVDASVLFVLQRLNTPRADVGMGWRFVERIVQSKRQFDVFVRRAE